MRRLVLIAILLVAGNAAAKPDSLEEAKLHYRAGDSHLKGGRFDEAVREYDAAYLLSKKPLLLYNIGIAYYLKAQKTDSQEDRKAAVEAFRRYLSAEPNGKQITAANGYVSELEKKFADVEAARPVPLPEPPPPEPPPVAAPTPAPRAEAPRDKGRGMRIAGLVTGGAGVALLATSVVFALKVSSVNSDLDALGPGQPWDHELYDSGKAAQRNMIICASLGGAAVAGGAVLYFVLGRRESHVQPVVGAHGAGLSYVTAF